MEVQDKIEPQDVEAAELHNNSKPAKAHWDANKHPKWNSVLSALGNKYPEDKFFSIIWKNPDRHNHFEKNKGFLWTTNQLQQRVICIPKGMHGNQNIRGIVINASHETTGHLGYRKM